MKYLIASLLALSLSGPVLAEPPTPASIEKLMVVTHSDRIIDQMFFSMDSMMRNLVNQSVQQNGMSKEGRQVLDNYMGRIMKVMREEMSWAKIKPIYVQVYAETFTQQEIDDMLAFYATPSGQSMIEKMPVVMKKSMALTQSHIAPLMQRMQLELQQAIAEVKAQQSAPPTE